MRVRVVFSVTVELDVDEASSLVTRTENRLWRRHYDLTTVPYEEPLTRLARCCGLFGVPLSRVDGWRDCRDGDVKVAITEVDVEKEGLAGADVVLSA